MKERYKLSWFDVDHPRKLLASVSAKRQHIGGERS